MNHKMVNGGATDGEMADGYTARARWMAECGLTVGQRRAACA